MLGSKLLQIIALTSFSQFCQPLPVSESSIEVREASPQFLPGAGETAEQAEGTISTERSNRFAPPKDKRASTPFNIEEDFPLTHAVLKMIRDAVPEPNDGLHKRQNSSDGSGISGISSLSPEAQSTLKDTMRYGIALVMKTGAWALSP